MVDVALGTEPTEAEAALYRRLVAGEELREGDYLLCKRTNPPVWHHGL